MDQVVLLEPTQELVGVDHQIQHNLREMVVLE
jgi:hypothetical protein